MNQEFTSLTARPDRLFYTVNGTSLLTVAIQMNGVLPKGIVGSGNGGDSR